jgi:pyridoxamine 5'-phosphate oxidase
MTAAMNERPKQASAGSCPDFTESVEPFVLFSEWMEDAKKSESIDPDAMALATADAQGLPDVRMILLKGFDERGFVFYSNEGSAKGAELAANPQAALVLYWKSLGRQIRARGAVEPVTAAEADAYFATRSRESRIGACCSDQSRPVASRAILEERVALRTKEIGGGDIPRPAYWRGYRIIPLQIEFWQNGAHRLHDRIVFRRDSLKAPWSKTRLYP